MNDKTKYATLQIGKIKTLDDLKHQESHNKRHEIPSNVIPEKMEQNEHHDIDTYNTIKDRMEEINKERKAEGVRKLRSDTVPAVELIVGASEGFFEGKTREEVIAWGQSNIEWAKKYFKDKGVGRLITFDLHFDEYGSPHLHLIFIPEKMIQDKRTGKTVPTLSAKEFEGGPQDINIMLDSFAKANEVYGLERVINYRKEGKKAPKSESPQVLRAKQERAEKRLEALEKVIASEEAKLARVMELLHALDVQTILALIKKRKPEAVSSLKGLDKGDLLNRVMELDLTD
jgi:hypothetical protein